MTSNKKWRGREKRWQLIIIQFYYGENLINNRRKSKNSFKTYKIGLTSLTNSPTSVVPTPTQSSTHPRSGNASLFGSDRNLRSSRDGFVFCVVCCFKRLIVRVITKIWVFWEICFIVIVSNLQEQEISTIDSWGKSSH
jgi:hypothetical protein